MNRIVIIGSGFSGTLAAIQLMRHQPEHRLHITLIERADFGRGVAYSTACSQHLLNVPAGKMSSLPDEPEHFINWLKHQNPKARDTDFVPRQIFGEYLSHCLVEAEQAKSATVHFQKVHQEAMAIQIESEGYAITLKDGSSLHADRVVLALGNHPNSLPNFPNSERFIANPWSADPFIQIPPDASLLIIGTGLTMIDTVLQLKAQNHRGKITALSRKGLLPQVHDLTCKPLNAFQLNACQNVAVTSIPELLRQFRAILAQGKTNWRSLVDGLRPQTQQLWQDLPEPEKKRFLRHVKPYWETHRHRMAPEVAEQIRRLIETQQLEILAGRIQKYEPSGAKVLIQPRGQAHTLLLEADYVINCSGSGTDFRQRTDALVMNLIQNGLIAPDALNMGLNCLPNGCLLDQDGNASNLYTLGPPMKGLLWESTAVPEIRQQAQALAATLIQSLSTDQQQLAQAGQSSR